MARYEEIPREKLSPRQQQLHDDFLKSRPRATLKGPFAVLINAPDVAEPADKLAATSVISPSSVGGWSS